MKIKLMSMLLTLTMLLAAFSLPTAAADAEPTTPTAGISFEGECRSAILMDAATGQVLYEHNADEALPPASVTKIMTLLLVMEAIADGKISLDDMVSTSAHAASMGGSQIYLKEGEQMCAEDLIKSVVIASANDAALALAEHIAGSEEAFVARMNERAAALGMKNTHFENTNGLDDTVENHVTSARDIALMSAELIRYPKILEYSGTWMDTIRDGAFGLTNTNRLVRFYKDATGLKTGSTAKAKFCVSATAKRDGMHLICVIMGAETRDSRNAVATKLLDHGFANYALYHAEGKTLPELRVTGGVENSCGLSYGAFDHVLTKGEQGKVTTELILPDSLAAPIAQGTEVGTVIYKMDDTILGKVPICTTERVEKIDFAGLLLRMFSAMLIK